MIYLNANATKLLAIIAMTIDHIAWLLFPGHSRELLPVLMHIIGRITCPIMCYFVAEGYHYTRNINKYTFRLFLFAIISHFPYMLVFGEAEGLKAFIPFYGGVLNQTSVMWSLAVGLVMLRVADSGLKDRIKSFLVVLLCALSLPADWSCIASLCILAMGTNRGDFKTQMRWMLIYTAMYAIVYIFTIDAVYGILQMAVVLSIPILKLYNGERGKNRQVNRVMKWLFYFYYPLHLLVLGLVQRSI